MKEDRYMESLEDSFDDCFCEIDSFFDMLKRVSDDRNILSLVDVGHVLLDDAQRKFEKICYPITHILGEISIQREDGYSPFSRDNETVGLEFRVSKTFNEILQNRQNKQWPLHFLAEKPEIGPNANNVSDISYIEEDAEAKEAELNGEEVKRALAEADTETKAQEETGQKPDSKITLTQ